MFFSIIGHKADKIETKNMTDPFFNPKKEFLRTLWKVIVILLIAAASVLLTSCRTRTLIERETVEVYVHDTVTVTVRDTVHVKVSDESARENREEQTRKTTTIYDTEGRVRTVIQEDKLSRAELEVMRHRYDSLFQENVRLQAVHRADSIQMHEQQEEEPQPAVTETWRDRLGNVLVSICLFALLLFFCAKGIAWMFHRN